MSNTARKRVRILRLVQVHLGLGRGTGKGWKDVGQEVARVTGWHTVENVGKGEARCLIGRYAREVMRLPQFDLSSAKLDRVVIGFDEPDPNPLRAEALVRKPRPAPRFDFYKSPDWRRVRYQALVQHGAQCQCCGSSSAQGKVMHVDHVLPRSLFPHLELEITNLQVLCEDCNLGKSNRDTTDWRSRSA